MSKKTKAKTQREIIEDTLYRENDIRGKGSIIAVVWSQMQMSTEATYGIAVRQMQLGNMDAIHFQVSGDYKTVRFLGKDRLVLEVK
jgi:hypothetical protein